MSASDNVMAGWAGAISGAQDVLSQYLGYKLKSKLNKEARADELDIYKQKLPLQVEAQRQEKQIGSDIDFDRAMKFLPHDTAAKLEVAGARTSTNRQPIDPQVAKALGLIGTPSLIPSEISAMGSLKRQEEGEGIKERGDERKMTNALKKAFPLAKVAINNVETSLDKEIALIDEILTDPDLGKVTGPYASRAPTATAGQARVRSKIEQLSSQAFLSSFTDLKRAAPNGSAGTGALSDSEGGKLQKARVNVDTLQATPDFVKGLGKYRTELLQSKQNFRSGFDDEFGDLIEERQPMPTDIIRKATEESEGGSSIKAEDLKIGNSFGGGKVKAVRWK